MNLHEELTPEVFSENLRSVVLEIAAIQSKLLALRNENPELLSEVSKNALARIAGATNTNSFQSKDLTPADLLVKQFSEIERAALELLRKQK